MAEGGVLADLIAPVCPTFSDSGVPVRIWGLDESRG